MLKTLKMLLLNLTQAEKQTQLKVDELAEQIREKSDRLNQIENSFASRENEAQHLESQMAEKLREFNETMQVSKKYLKL